MGTVGALFWALHLFNEERKRQRRSQVSRLGSRQREEIDEREDKVRYIRGLILYNGSDLPLELEAVIVAGANATILPEGKKKKQLWFEGDWQAGITIAPGEEISIVCGYEAYNKGTKRAKRPRLGTLIRDFSGQAWLVPAGGGKLIPAEARKLDSYTSIDFQMLN